MEFFIKITARMFKRSIYKKKDKNKIIAEDPKSSELVEPINRNRD